MGRLKSLSEQLNRLSWVLGEKSPRYGSCPLALLANTLQCDCLEQLRCQAAPRGNYQSPLSLFSIKSRSSFCNQTLLLKIIFLFRFRRIRKFIQNIVKSVIILYGTLRNLHSFLAKKVISVKVHNGRFSVLVPC